LDIRAQAEPTLARFVVAAQAAVVTTPVRPALLAITGVENTCSVLAVFSAAALAAYAAAAIAPALLVVAINKNALAVLALLTAAALATGVSATSVAAYLVLAGRLTRAGGVNAAQGDKVALDL